MAFKRLIQAVMDRKTGKESLMDSRGEGAKNYFEEKRRVKLSAKR